MNTPTKIILGSVCAAAVFWCGYRFGWHNGAHAVAGGFPSCIYIARPFNSDVKPLGCDGKEGLDMPYSRISGGGYYVSLHLWKAKEDRKYMDTPPSIPLPDPTDSTKAR